MRCHSCCLVTQENLKPSQPHRELRPLDPAPQSSQTENHRHRMFMGNIEFAHRFMQLTLWNKK